METKVISLLALLAKVRTFEEAADAILHPIMGLAAEALKQSPYARSGRILRAMVHLRPADGYRRLMVAQAADEPTEAPDPRALHPSCLPSATAFRWVVEHCCAVEIDVQLGVVHVDRDGASFIAEGRGSKRFDSDKSLALLSEREATHVLAVPLRPPGGVIDGMISIEASCHAAKGKRFIWPECSQRAQVLADIAAPHLATLPMRPAECAAPDDLLPVIGASMTGVVEMLRVFAQQEETILLSGPTGSGKSRLARWCHAQSEQRSRRFETLDLSTVPEDLQMGELFGWKKGAFTGAHKDTAGCVARAEDGTLFIDEIDKLSLKAQAGLLRVLEERRYRPLGEGAGDRSARVRFIIGTNADLYAAVREGRFREDLYYRINVLPVKVPSLRERPDEIPRWAEYMLDRREHSGAGDTRARLSPDGERALLGYAWPGNLRQLDNIMRRACALARLSHGTPPKELTLEAHHIERALAYERAPSAKSILELFHTAATAFVLEAEHRREQGSSLDLDLTDAMKGFVLGAAAEKLGSNEEAFLLFGKEAMVHNRNHQKALRREMDRVEAICRALGQEASLPFSRLSMGDDK